jgi:Ca2+-binding RTX toxin-like protein
VGGADDGVSLLRLVPGGRLEHVSTIEDTERITLDNVSALALSPNEAGNRLILTAASVTEPGLTSFDVKLGSMGTALMGAGVERVVTGTTKEDFFLATSADDTFQGRGGADTFILFADGSADRVLDYQRNFDRLDLGGIPLLHSVDQLTIIPRKVGATVRFGDFKVTLRASDAKPLNADDLRLETSLSHSPTGTVLQGTTTDTRPQTVDSLPRIVGHTVVDGKTLYDGGGGEDLLNFARVDGRVIVDLQVNLTGSTILKQFQDGEAAGLKIRNFEHLRGSSQSDTLRGDEGVNILRGGPGRDMQFGRAGNDSLDGGVGWDVLVGGAGADLLTGGPGAGHDRFVFKSDRDSGPGASQRDRINDFHRGEDVIDLSHFDAAPAARGHQHFTFIKTAGFSSVGQLRYEHDAGKTMLQADLDGDHLADFEVEMAGTLTLRAHDFLF